MVESLRSIEYNGLFDLKAHDSPFDIKAHDRQNTLNLESKIQNLNSKIPSSLQWYKN